MKRVLQHKGRLFSSTSQGAGPREPKKVVSLDDVWSLMTDRRIQKIKGGIFFGGIIVASAYHFEKKVNQNFEEIKDLKEEMRQLDAKVDRQFSTLDAKIDRQFSTLDAKIATLDAKMDRQFATIMAFTALGRLPGGFSDVPVPPEAKQSADVVS
jgi:outer membrane murein-binding lipoprotein Lpp